MMTIQENIQQAFDPERAVIKSPLELREKLEALANGVADRLPAGLGVNIQRSSERGFIFSIVENAYMRPVQQFGIQLDNNDQVRWAAVI